MKPLSNDGFDLYLQQGWHELRRTRRSNLRFRARADEAGFRCVNCRYHVLADAVLSGVGNRNHCPYCLWSRHMDHYKPGDRLSACNMPMQPIGLTLKQAHKRYAGQGQGEMMLIHRCTGCNKIDINRIAADDDADRLLEVFYAGIQLDARIKKALAQEDIRLLGDADTRLVRARLFGRA